MPGGQVKPNIITVFDKKGSCPTSIEVSLNKAAGESFTGRAGDVAVFENVMVKNCGTCYLINGTNALYNVSSKGDHFKFL